MPKRKAAVAGEAQRKRAKTGDTHTIDKLSLRWGREGRMSASGVSPLLALTGVDLPGRTKVAGFDIDYTVIQTKSGRKFATGSKDWKWLYDVVPDRLRELHNEGYRVVLFTNQAGIEKMKLSTTEIMTKVNDIIEQLDIPVFCFVCTGENQYRKPSTCVWQYLTERCNEDVAVDLTKSLFVGDAAGRAKNWAPGKPKDFSCTDRMFAANIGIDFKTPEEFYLNEEPVEFTWGSLDPAEYLNKNRGKKHAEEYHSKTQEVVLMVGPPASGKSTFSQKFLVPKGYVRVNRDTLKTAAACLKATGAALAKKQSVVVDNTNPSKAARADYIDLARQEGVPVRCFVMETPLQLAHHLNYVRQTHTNGEVRRVPDVGYNMYKKNYQPPDTSEGFTEIKDVHFIPEFSSKKYEQIFTNWSGAGH